MKKITKFDLLLYILIILFGLVLFTSCLTSKLYARYISSADGGDFARVAVWKVNATGDDDNLKIDLFKATTVEDVFDDVYQIEVENNSEVAANYDIIVIFEKELQSSVNFFLDDTIQGTTDDNKRFVFANVGNLDLHNDSAAHTLKFTAKYKDFSLDYSNNFTVMVDFKQID